MPAGYCALRWLAFLRMQLVGCNKRSALHRMESEYIWRNALWLLRLTRVFGPGNFTISTESTAPYAGWPYSTFHQWVAQGVYPSDWSGGAEDSLGYED